MRISDAFNLKKPIVSFEVFPPKLDIPIETVFDTIEEIKKIEPSFISVTYGAGGGNRSRTIEISSKIKNDFGIEALSHLTCVNSSKQDIDSILDSLSSQNINNILALRGDAPKDNPDFSFQSQEFKHASDLVSYISQRNDFCIGSACYPEGHVEAVNRGEDIEYLKMKVDSGVDFLITQLFFSNEILYKFLDEIRAKGIHLPVSAGIMPIYNTNLIKKLTLTCGARIPRKLLIILNKYENQPNELKKAGIEYSVNQIRELVANGIDGVHIYTMNKPNLAKEIHKEAGL